MHVGLRDCRILPSVNARQGRCNRQQAKGVAERNSRLTERTFTLAYRQYRSMSQIPRGVSRVHTPPLEMLSVGYQDVRRNLQQRAASTQDGRRGLLQGELPGQGGEGLRHGSSEVSVQLVRGVLEQRVLGRSLVGSACPEGVEGLSQDSLFTCKRALLIFAVH